MVGKLFHIQAKITAMGSFNYCERRECELVNGFKQVTCKEIYSFTEFTFLLTTSCLPACKAILSDPAITFEFLDIESSVFVCWYILIKGGHVLVSRSFG